MQLLRKSHQTGVSECTFWAHFENGSNMLMSHSNKLVNPKAVFQLKSIVIRKLTSKRHRFKSNYLRPITDSHILCHSLSFDKGGSETRPSVAFSMEGPMSWTNLTDSDSRLSKFIKEITSFLCNCSWKTHKMNFEGTQKRCLYCIFNYLAMTAQFTIKQ